jgi:hypothetical protein
MPIDAITGRSPVNVVDHTEDNKHHLPPVTLKNVNDKPSLSRLDLVKKKFNDDSVNFHDSTKIVKCNNFSMNFIDVFIKNSPDLSKIIKSLSLSTQNAESIARNISENTQARTLDIIAYGKENHLVDCQLWGDFFHSQFIKMHDEGVLIKPFLIYLLPRMISKKLNDYTVAIHHALAAVLAINNGCYQIMVYDPKKTTGYFATELAELSSIKEADIFSFMSNEDSVGVMVDESGNLLYRLSYFTAVPGHWNGECFTLSHKRNQQRDISSLYLTEKTRMTQQEFFYAALTGMPLKSVVSLLQQTPMNERIALLSLENKPAQTITGYLAGLPDKDCHLLRNYFSLIKEAMKQGLLDKQEMIRQLSDKVVEDAGYAWFEVTLFTRTCLRSDTGKTGRVFADEIVNMIEENILSADEGKAILNDIILVKEKEGGSVTEYPGCEFARLKHYIQAVETREMIRTKFPEWYFGEQ